MPVSGVDAMVPLPVAALGPYGLVGRYVCDPANPKCVTVPEAHGYLKAGKALLLYYEDGAMDALGFEGPRGRVPGGAPAGKAKAELAKPTLDALGWPSNEAVHFAADFSVVGSEPAMVLECVQAFAAVLGLPEGGYGDVNACDYLGAHGVRSLVQFGAGVSSYRSVYQGYDPSLYVGGVQCDPLTAERADFGAWKPSSTPEVPMFLVYDQTHDAWWLVSGERKEAMSPAQLPALLAEGIPRKTVPTDFTAAELAALHEFPAGTF